MRWTEIPFPSPAVIASVVETEDWDAQMRSYAVNSRSADWKTRSIFTYVFILWLTSFHATNSTMLANKWNCVLETTGLLFFLPRDDFLEPRRSTSESNEQSYRMMRRKKREFSLADSVYLIDQICLRVNSLFAGDLVHDRSNSFKGHSSTLPDFVASMREGSMSQQPGGPVHVDLDLPAVTQLWPEVKKIIHLVNQVMKPFLEVFGVVEGNGLSPFMRDFKTPEELICEI